MLNASQKRAARRARAVLTKLQRPCQAPGDAGTFYPFYYVSHLHRKQGITAFCEDCRAILLLQQEVAFRRWCEGADGPATDADEAACPPDPLAPTPAAVQELEARNLRHYQIPILPEDEWSLRAEIAAGVCPQDAKDYRRQMALAARQARLGL